MLLADVCGIRVTAYVVAAVPSLVSLDCRVIRKVDATGKGVDTAVDEQVFVVLVIKSDAYG